MRRPVYGTVCRMKHVHSFADWSVSWMTLAVNVLFVLPNLYKKFFGLLFACAYQVAYFVAYFPYFSLQFLSCKANQRALH